MRFLIAVILGLGLVASASVAKADTRGHNFGSATCPIRVPCPDSGNLSSSDLVADADSCIKQYFGYTSSSGFFDESYGLDSNNCLSLKQGAAISKGTGTQLIPECCVVKAADQSCVISCDIHN